MVIIIFYMILFLYKKLIVFASVLQRRKGMYTQMKFMYLIATLAIFADGFIFNKINKNPSLQLRNSNNNLILCNEKYMYMKYLIGIRNFKRVYRIIKDNHFADIQNAINILNILNYLNNTQVMNDNNSGNPMYINNTDKIAKTLILSNIYIDVSAVKYIQISTKNDTLIVELDKNNPNALYDIGKIDNFLSSISLLMKLVNIN